MSTSEREDATDLRRHAELRRATVFFDGRCLALGPGSGFFQSVVGRHSTRHIPIREVMDAEVTSPGLLRSGRLTFHLRGDGTGARSLVLEFTERQERDVRALVRAVMHAVA
ncbi:MAG: hypothetical protein J2P19_00055 [Pseudonocardia sp.]|nr:hypothetical protein [Pseudonocardia sp.]